MITKEEVPDSGKIIIGGIDLDYVKKRHIPGYRRRLGVVFQDFKLFAFELGQNVAAGNEVDEKRAEACLKQAGFSERMETMEEGLKTYLYKDFNEKGVEVSGGEAQKIALARALYKDAPFMILDEPTAALDPIAEAEVYAKFNGITKNKTAVYISHRLSSCRFCDEIAVLDRGRLVQKGDHQTLVEDKKGKYFELWQAQAQYYTK